MTRKRIAPLRGVAAHFARGSAVLAGLAVVMTGCAEPTPTEGSIEMPLVASAYEGHTGTVGRSFLQDMSQEVTSTFSGDPDGIGTALITLNAGSSTICWSLTASNIALPATASHIHRAPAGLAGPVVLPLTAPGADGSSSGCAEGVSRELIVEILSNPSAFYVNVHTTQHPPGAVRAQLD